MRMSNSNEASAARRPATKPSLALQYAATRTASLEIAAPLSAEDQSAQSMPDASPVKWHLAHTTWFFETFVLGPQTGAAPFDPTFVYLFNSYYEAVGPRHARPKRGLLTRPSAQEVLAYRRLVDEAMTALLEAGVNDEVEALVRLGLAHEQQHQELMLTDVLHLFAQNPIGPVYRPASGGAAHESGPLSLLPFEGGVVEIGAAADLAFSFDNEEPRHQVMLRPFRLADRLTTNGEWLSFMEAGGYARPELWLSDGWARATEAGWTAPLYWEKTEAGWRTFTLGGWRPLDLDAPVVHVSFYEADAFARWRGLRLPTEAEWEHAATRRGGGGLRQLYDTAWQWTASAYAPYPGYRPAEGAVGEYNGKFMINQLVLRGGSWATPPDHSRPTYRNFFHPDQRWQFSGVRLAEDGAARPGPASIGRREEDAGAFRRDVLAGLTARPKRLPSKYLYDREGSRLFEAICELPEYYPTRTETALLREIAPTIAAQIPPGAVLVEYGSGASQKTRLLLDAAPQIAGYVPIDVSRDALATAAQAIARDYPGLQVAPMLGDFTRRLSLPAVADGATRVGFFPGSTIGNFETEEAGRLLADAAELMGPGGLFVVGVDLLKSIETLEAAYDDAAGVTAAFNLNLLRRINRELEGDFDLAAFAHRADWNAAAGRIEMRLESLRNQTVKIAGEVVAFAAGETIHTENCHKYTMEEFSVLAEQSGWTVEGAWASSAPSFAIILLRGRG
jgi:dimethylhistidine N-methyltransferase